MNRQPKLDASNILWQQILAANKDKLRPEPHPIDIDRLNRLIEQIAEKFGLGYAREVEFMSKYIQYISFDYFMQQLQYSVDKYNSQDHIEPTFLILGPGTKKGMGMGEAEKRKTTMSSNVNLCYRKDKSNYWLPQLAWQMFTVQPSFVIQCFEDALQSTQAAGVDSIHIVLLDDGSFSGEQLRQFLNEIFSTVRTNPWWQHFELSLIVPFITDSALKLLQRTIRGHKMNVHIYYNYIMKTLYQQIEAEYPDLHEDEIPDTTEYRLARAVMTSRKANLPLIYFDHKVPDSKSTDNDFLEHGLQNNPENFPGLVPIKNCPETFQGPCPYPPYKKYDYM